jgi:hypothetical protein
LSKKALEILSKTLSTIPDAKGQPQPHMYVVFKDENGMIGMVMIPGKEASDAAIKDAVLKQREEQKARKAHVIPL